MTLIYSLMPVRIQPFTSKYTPPALSFSTLPIIHWGATCSFFIWEQSWLQPNTLATVTHRHIDSPYTTCPYSPPLYQTHTHPSFCPKCLLCPLLSPKQNECFHCWPVAPNRARKEAVFWTYCHYTLKSNFTFIIPSSEQVTPTSQPEYVCKFGRSH